MPLLGIEAFARGASPGTLAWLEVLFGPPKLISNVISGIICLTMFEVRTTVAGLYIRVCWSCVPAFDWLERRMVVER